MQLSLPLDGHDRDALDAVLDDVRGRYGSKAIVRAVLLGRDGRPPPPLLPD
jgi:DNA polymerase-4